MVEETAVQEAAATGLDEATLSSEYPFLSGLSKDHPALAERVAKQIPQWKEQVTGVVGNPQVAEAILQSVDYVTDEEIGRKVQEWADELTRRLRENPTREARVLAVLGGSQQYYSGQVLKLVPEELRPRIKVLSDIEAAQIEMYQLAEDVNKLAGTDFYFYDDTVNSGQQLANTVLPKFKNATTGARQSCGGSREKTDRFFEILDGPDEQKPQVIIRVMRITNEAKVRAFQMWENVAAYGQDKKYFLHLDISGRKAATVDDALSGVGLPWERESGLRSFYEAHHGRNPTTLVLLRNKIPDNLPPILLNGQFNERDITPLFDQKDITPPYKSV